VEFKAERLSWHYTAKVILPLLLIVMMSWAAFWLDSSMGAAQLGVATSSMLTLIAYRFSVGADVPKIPYLTKLDSFILISSILIFFTLIEVIVTTTLTFKKRQDLSKKIDHYCRVCFPLAYAVILTAIMLF
jgi:cadmium resistance protein CadD (predicted permease)